MRPRYRRDTFEVRHAHGYGVQTLADLGIAGAAVSLALLAAFLAAAARTTALRQGARVAHTPERIGMLTLLAVVADLRRALAHRLDVVRARHRDAGAAGGRLARGPRAGRRGARAAAGPPAPRACDRGGGRRARRARGGVADVAAAALRARGRRRAGGGRRAPPARRTRPRRPRRGPQPALGGAAVRPRRGRGGRARPARCAARARGGGAPPARRRRDVAAPGRVRADQRGTARGRPARGRRGAVPRPALAGRAGAVPRGAAPSGREAAPGLLPPQQALPPASSGGDPGETREAPALQEPAAP